MPAFLCLARCVFGLDKEQFTRVVILGILVNLAFRLWLKAIHVHGKTIQVIRPLMICTSAKTTN